MITILTQAAVGEFIVGLGTRAKALQADIHQAAVSTLDHTREFGDYRGALALVNALPNGQRVVALVEWYKGMSNGKLTFKKGADGAYTADLKKDRADTDFDIAAAMLTDFGAYTKESKPTSLTVDGLIKMLSTKADSTETNADGSPKVSHEARAVAAMLVGAYRKAAANITIQ